MFYTSCYLRKRLDKSRRWDERILLNKRTKLSDEESQEKRKHVRPSCGKEDIIKMIVICGSEIRTGLTGSEI